MTESKRQIPEKNGRTNAKSAQRKAPLRKYRIPLAREEKTAIDAAAKKRGLTTNEFAEQAIRKELARSGRKGRGALVRQSKRLTKSFDRPITVAATKEVPGAIFEHRKGAAVADRVRTGEIDWNGDEFSQALRDGRFLITRLSPFHRMALVAAGEKSFYGQFLAMLPTPELAALRGSTLLYHVERFKPDETLFVSLRGPLPAGSDPAFGKRSRKALGVALQAHGIDREMSRTLDILDEIYRRGDRSTIKIVELFLGALEREIEAAKRDAKGGAK
ncbi:MAG TPA: hypothetical protein VGG02_00540 [Chthoniobacterales bacterium]|jgi:hypothetical protein